MVGTRRQPCTPMAGHRSMTDVGASSADLVIVNARVFVGGDPRRPQALPLGSRDGPAPPGSPTAVAVSAGRIAWVGLSRDAGAWRSPRTEVFDARGGLVTPGFEDAHLHFWMGALSLAQVDLQGADTVEDLAAILGRWRNEHPEASWVVGRGWHYGIFPSGMPDRALLDHLVPDRPALLECFDAHTHWANSAALARAGVTAESPDPARGTIERDAAGEPTGILKEFAHELFEGLIPTPSEDERAELARAAVALAQRHGVTAVQDAWTDIDDLHRHARLRDGDVPGVRVRIAMPAEEADWSDGVDQGRRRWKDRLKRYRSELTMVGPDAWLSGGIVKAFGDGVIETGTAWMLGPYEGQDAGERRIFGRPNWTADGLAAMTAMAAEQGWQVEIHAIGDGAIRAALDAHERAPSARGRVEHIEWPDPADVPRFGRLGIVASMQPEHASPVPHKAAVRERWIGRRTERGWPWASILRGGGVVAFGSDWPVATLDPLVHLRVAVTRTDDRGHPPGGWLPAERLTVAEALACATWGGAYAALAEDRRGTVEVGKAADLVILDRDLLVEGATAIAGTTVQATISAGRVVYRAS